MTVTLTKGGNMLLADEAPGITEVRVGIGWSAGPGSAAVEIDGVVSLANGGPTGRLLLSHQVPNPDEPLGAHPGATMPVGDAERLVVRLDAVPASVSRLTFGGVIFDATARRQTFRSVRDAYIRVLNHANGIEVARYTLDVETGSETAMVFGELYRHSRGWKFRAVGQGYAAGLRGIVGDGDPDVVRPGDVTNYLRRISPARTRRSVQDLLHPPVAAPPPAQPRVQSQPARVQSQPVRPVTPPPPPKTGTPAPKAPTPPSKAPTPPARPSAPPAQPAARNRSVLDLSEPGEETPASTGSGGSVGTAGTGSRNRGGSRNGGGGSAVTYGEHSSRRRQRDEHVSVLDDEHPATTWTEQDRGSGGMTITLRWEPLKTSSGLPRPSDLHLGAFWQSADRAEGILQTLGNTISAPGAAGSRQVLRLGRRDEREGQTVFVDLAALPTFRRFFVYAYGQHGSPEWALLRPEIVVTAPSGESLSIRPGDAPVSARLCVVASFHVVDGDLVIRRENDYVDGVQANAGETYGWFLDWNPDGMTLRSSSRPQF